MLQLLSSFSRLTEAHLNNQLPCVALEFHLVFDGVTSDVLFNETGKNKGHDFVLALDRAVHRVSPSMLRSPAPHCPIFDSTTWLVFPAHLSPRSTLRVIFTGELSVSSRAVRTPYGWKSVHNFAGDDVKDLKLFVHYKVSELAVFSILRRLLILPRLSPHVS